MPSKQIKAQWRRGRPPEVTGFYLIIWKNGDLAAAMVRREAYVEGPVDGRETYYAFISDDCSCNLDNPDPHCDPARVAWNFGPLPKPRIRKVKADG